MRRKLFRLSVALLALAAAATAAPTYASAFQGCPHDIVYGGTACSLWGPPGDCASCWYSCNGVGCQHRDELHTFTGENCTLGRGVSPV